MNRAELTGRLTKDVKLHRTTKKQTPVVSFSLAVDDPFKRNNRKRHTDFPNVTVWGKQAEILVKYAKKGSLIGILGRTHTDTYTNKNGKRVFVQEIVADSFDGMELLDTKGHHQKDTDNSDTNENDTEGEEPDDEDDVYHGELPD